MRRRLSIALVTAGIAATAVATAGVLLGGEPVAAHAGSQEPRLARSAPGAQPDTSSPHWKSISDDLGVWIREDERLGLRGRLYVRVDGLWWPVATDGPADLSSATPLR
jgi:hypothetical protein